MSNANDVDRRPTEEQLDRKYEGYRKGLIQGHNGLVVD